MEQLWCTYCFLGQYFVRPSLNNHSNNSSDPKFFGMYLVNDVVVPPQMIDINANGTIFSFAPLIWQSPPLLEPLPSLPYSPMGTSYIKKLLMNRTNYEIQFYDVGNITSGAKLASSGKFTIVHGGPEPGTETAAVSGTSTAAATTGSTRPPNL